jgi:hypothetical protein
MNTNNSAIKQYLNSIAVSPEPALPNRVGSEREYENLVAVNFNFGVALS